MKISRSIREPLDTAHTYIRRMEEFAALIESTGRDADGWETMAVRDNVKMMRKQYPGADGICFKGVTKIQTKPSAVYRFLNSTDVNWDGSLLEETIETFANTRSGQDMCVYHVAYPAATFLGSARDFCLFWGCSRRSDGYVVVIKSVPDHPRCKEHPDYQRAAIHWGGYIIVPSKSNPNHSVIFSVVQIDAKGWMPGTISENMGEEWVGNLAKLRDAIMANQISSSSSSHH
eukprot:comp10329_c0_seq1/m.12487 comp10329_c0_seq1/g.12487  ORF comp10329_c0_seq1/g.12487 comp10329_c0_seq1/m.12487 type:complete len:231 (-) comp10329_c0_seq1:28-720(-)